MLFEGVNFNEGEVRKMSPGEFESRHLDLFWLDRDEATRKKMLGQVYAIIGKSAGRGNKKKGK